MHADIPEAVRKKAAICGAGAWLEGLPRLTADLQDDWGFTIGRVYTGGTEAFVADATLSDGTEAVLKLMIPRAGDAARNEIAVLRLARGHGCPRLLRADAGRCAMLLERLGPSLFELKLPLAARHEILCAAAMQLWRPAPDVALPSGAEKARWLADYVARTWEALGRPCSERAVDDALRCARRREAAHDPERAVLVHGDVHQWNALQATDGFKLVDPDGLLAEAEYDMGVLMREDPEASAHGDPMDRARWLARRTGLDATAIWEWGVAERVSTGLLCTSVDLQPLGRQMLAVADALARHV